MESYEDYNRMAIYGNNTSFRLSYLEHAGGRGRWETKVESSA